MRLNDEKKWGVYAKLLLGIVLCTVLTITISSTILFIYFDRIALQQDYKSDLRDLTQTSREVIHMTDSAQSLTFQLYRNMNITKLMFYPEPSIYDSIAAMNELTNYLSSMPYIESIYVYNPDSKYVYIAADSGQNGLLTKQELSDKGILDLLEHYREYTPFTPIPRTYKSNDESGTKSVYTYLCYDGIGRRETLNSAIIVNISVSWINKEMADGNQGQGRSFIIDNRGELLSGDDLSPVPFTAEGEKILRSITDNGVEGYSLSRIDGRKYLVSYTKPDALDWRYVRVTPYELVTRNIRGIRTTTILITLAILAAGILVSWLLSRKLYVPYGLIASRMQTLETANRNNVYTLRQHLLRELVMGNEPINLKSLRAKLSHMNISFEFQKPYRLVLLRIDQFQQFSSLRGADLKAYRYAMMNIASELGMKFYSVETIEMEEDTILLLFGDSDTLDMEDETALMLLLRQIQQAIREHLHIEISMTYSALEQQVLHLKALYNQVISASGHRFFHGLGAVIKAQEVVRPDSKAYVFPVDKEKRMVDALMAGKTEEAVVCVKAIMEGTKAYPIGAVQSAIARLTLTLNNVLYTFHKNRLIDADSVPVLVTSAVEELETMEEVNVAFQTAIEYLQGLVLEKRSTKQEDLIRRINAIVDEKYCDPNLSLNAIAYELDLTPSHLGRIYKQMTLETLVDVINRTRVEKSAELLNRTHEPVSEIAEKTGFTNTSYFYRMFKKYYGLTPNDYRKNLM
ncbi:AraC family transcriptional regulator [Paenibacillus sp. 19GGS1-52]|uniref:AraC family transcriptional regulator n=1 Tax=Paenibacillus sp. 19GGS1-52 TaxID=2758563 RepID=UPI001EFA9747|nr:AraC family transcriptional regulator [Paenibacillus sp. 19GGS1-52]ULO08431.1 AraC family transcriptional regulator [Paenibacillus sp. 19GGS1-52]